MKSMIRILLLLIILTGCEDTNLHLATEAGLDAVKAVTLSREEVGLLAERAVALSDQNNPVPGPGSPYSRRLAALTKGHGRIQGRDFDFKVYLSPEINAFAMANGSVRVYSGLMDKMNDDELLFVIGHEIGHVIEEHVQKKIMVAYAASALRKGIASQENMAGMIAESALGGFVQDLANARFSQAEEAAADRFGLVFLRERGYGEKAAAAVGAQALEKLSAPGQYALLASHPAPDKRKKAIMDSLEKGRETPWWEKTKEGIMAGLTRLKELFRN